MTTIRWIPSDLPNIETALYLVRDALGFVTNASARAELLAAPMSAQAGYRARAAKPVKAGRARCERCGKDLVLLKDGGFPAHGPPILVLIEPVKSDCPRSGYEDRAYIYGRKLYQTPAKAMGAMRDQLDGPPDSGDHDDVAFLGAPEDRIAADRAYLQWARGIGSRETYEAARAKLPGAPQSEDSP